MRNNNGTEMLDMSEWADDLDAHLCGTEIEYTVDPVSDEPELINVCLFDEQLELQVDLQVTLDEDPMYHVHKAVTVCSESGVAPLVKNLAEHVLCYVSPRQSTRSDMFVTILNAFYRAKRAIDWWSATKTGERDDIDEPDDTEEPDALKERDDIEDTIKELESIEELDEIEMPPVRVNRSKIFSFRRFERCDRCGGTGHINVTRRRADKTRTWIALCSEPCPECEKGYKKMTPRPSDFSQLTAEEISALLVREFPEVDWESPSEDDDGFLLTGVFDNTKVTMLFVKSRYFKVAAHVWTRETSPTFVDSVEFALPCSPDYGMDLREPGTLRRLVRQCVEARIEQHMKELAVWRKTSFQ
jgi:hypothetical protein